MKLFQNTWTGARQYTLTSPLIFEMDGPSIRWTMFSVVLLVFLALCASSEGRMTNTHQARLIEDLFDGYNPMIRPVYNHTTITDVSMILILATVIDMDERNQLLISNTWASLSWTDEFLTWDPAEYGGVDSIKVTSQNVWLPDIVLYNNADEYKSFLIKQLVIVYSNGDVLWAAPVIFKSSCSVDVTHFPFDVQNCSMKFGPWQHVGEEVWMHGSFDEGTYESDGQWDLVSMDATPHAQVYADHPDVVYTDVVYHVILKRRPFYFIMNLLLPNALFTLVTITVFYLPPESGEKISLSITILLALTVFQLVLADFMPPSSYLPYLGYYFVVVMILVCLSLVSSVLIVNLHFGNSDDDGMPRWVRRVFVHYLAVKLRVYKHVPPNPSPSNISTNRLEELKRTPTYVRASMSNGEVLIPLMRKNNGEGTFANERGSNAQRKVRINPCDESEIVIDLLSELKSVAKYHELKRREDIIKKDWKIVAMVVDKLMLYVYCLGSVMATVIFATQMFTTMHKMNQ